MDLFIIFLSGGIILWLILITLLIIQRNKDIEEIKNKLIEYNYKNRTTMNEILHEIGISSVELHYLKIQINSQQETIKNYMNKNKLFNFLENKRK
jgi:hypothetical protein